MSNEDFLHRLNKALTAYGYSDDYDARAKALERCSDVSFYTARSILNGLIIPSTNVANDIATYLGVSKDWLLGLSNEKYEKST